MEIGILAARVRGRLRRHVADPITYGVRAIRNADRIFQPIFVTGAMGSGTTLTGRILGERFELAGVIDESCLQIQSSSVLHGGPIATHPDVRTYARSLEPDASWRTDRVVADLMALYRRRASGEASLIVDKAANSHMVRADFLLDCFPDACMVAVFRDPVANVEGFRRKWPIFGRDSLDACMDFYRTIHERFLETRQRRRERTLLLEYESLVADPEGSVELLGSQLGLRPAAAPQRLEARPNRPGQGLRNVDGGSIRIVRDANAMSYEGLAEDLRARIQSELGELHERLRAEADNVD